MFKRFILLLVLPLTFCTVNQPVQEFTHAESCLAANIFFEARGEGRRGMETVAAVTLNRVQSPKYPKDVCSVVFQKKQFSWTHQQSRKVIWRVLNGSLEGFNAKDRAAYREAKIIAQKALKAELGIEIPTNVLWYHTKQVKPSWSKRLQKLGSVGQHILYKEK